MKVKLLPPLIRGAAIVLVAGLAMAAQGAAETNAGWQVRRDFLVQNWQLDQGLPRNSITSIAQDQQGYLWFGTPNGLIRFDGVRFAAFEEDALPGFKQGHVQQIHCDAAGDLWLATRRSGAYRGKARLHHCWW